MSTAVPDRTTLRAALALATRAPSVHNTQPWRWRLGGETIHLYADQERRVPATDPDARDLLISCGAVLHHLRVALAAFGWTASVHRLPNPEIPDHLASLELHPHEPTDQDVATAALISRRRTDRRRMADWPIPPDHLSLVAGSANQQGALAVPVIDPSARFVLAGAIAQAAVIQESSPAYSHELSNWAGTARGGYEGVPTASIPITPEDDELRTFPHGTLPQTTGKRYGQQTELLVVATSGDDALSRLRAGEATSAALLTATELGLASCPLSQPLEIAESRRVIRDDILNGMGEPQLLIRLGWLPTTAGALPPTPRRDVADIIDSSDD